MHTAIIKALEERQRQIHEEGFTAEHDDLWNDGELCDAAASYALEAANQNNGSFRPETWVPISWPVNWQKTWWKPSDDPQRNIIKAMALLSAEYDRIERVKAAATPAPAEELRYSTDDEWQSHIYDDLTDIIEDRELEEGNTVYIGVKRLAQPNDFTEDLDDVVIDRMADRPENEYGEHAEAYPMLEAPQMQTLQILIETWAATHCRPDFYTIDNVRAYTLTHDDIANARKESQV